MNLIQMTIISTNLGKDPLWIALIVSERVQNSVLWCNLKNHRMISFHFQGEPFNITIIQVKGPTTNAKEAEV